MSVSQLNRHKADYYEAGFDACMHGGKIDDCPLSGKPKYYWERGFKVAEAWNQIKRKRK